MLTPPYKTEAGPPSPSQADFARQAATEFKELLATSPNERTVQLFLEQHPLLLPGAWTPGFRSGHSPLFGLCVTQPPLTGISPKVPDFMWISSHSAAWFPTLIEIERPDKRFFTAAGLPTADFSQAHNQLAQWRAWFAKPENQLIFAREYGVPDEFTKCIPMKVSLLLIYGRRSEFTSERELQTQRANIALAPDEELMSFDRLTPDLHLSQAITARAIGAGKFHACAIQPTFAPGPASAKDYLSIDGLDEAIEACLGITSARKEFLKRRVKYWKNWAASTESHSVIEVGLRE